MVAMTEAPMQINASAGTISLHRIIRVRNPPAPPGPPALPALKIQVHAELERPAAEGRPGNPPEGRVRRIRYRPSELRTGQEIVEVGANLPPGPPANGTLT